MKKKRIRKIDIILILILIMIIALIGLLFSYARFHVESINDTTTTTIRGTFECLDVNYNEEGVIGLNKNYPVTDAYALENFTPINVTITNNCSSEATPINYTMSLATIYEKTKNYVEEYIPEGKIKIKVLKNVGAGTEYTKYNINYLSNIDKFSTDSLSYSYIMSHYNSETIYQNYNVKDIYNLDMNTISSNETINYKIYIWIDYYEGNPEQTENEEYDNSTKGKIFETSVALTINGEESIYQKLTKAPAASFMVANQSEIEGLWSSGLEGDGLRYVGSGSYNSETTPDNFICFGTTSMDECKANENKYMYRIIGVFPDEEGNQHLKLRKFKQLISKPWNDTAEDKNWRESTLYTDLNGTGFLGNTTYSYLQDKTWSNKIVNWKWTAVNTLTKSDSGPHYYTGTTMTPENIYLHEMNLSTKTNNIGEWTYPTGKIGLIYASDYVLSLGDEALALIGSTSKNAAKLKTGWMHLSNNGSSTSEWTLARYGAFGSNDFTAWHVHGTGYVHYDGVNYSRGAVPVFYLTSETTISGGMGTYSEPYVIK